MIKINQIFLIFLITFNNLYSNNSPFENFVISFWPEYDKEGVLVILTGEIKEDRLPLNIKIPIPNEVDSVLSIGHDITSNDLTLINIFSNSNGSQIDEFYYSKEFQIEFYHNPFGNSSLRNFNYDFKINHYLKDYYLAIQKPLSSKNFVFSEVDFDTISDQHGLEYFRKRLFNLDANKNKLINLNYLNDEKKLSIEILEQSLSNFSNDDVNNQTNISTMIQRYRLPTYEPYLLLFITFFIISIIFYFYEKNKITLNSNNNINFCHSCGKKIKSSINYCPYCGEKIK